MSNFLKSVYISVYITALCVASVHAVNGLMENGLTSAWAGIALAIWPALLFFVRLFVAPIPRTSANLNGLTIIASAGAALSILLASNANQNFYALVYGSALGVGGLLLYIFWYSRLGRGPNEQISVGQKLPEFQLKTSLGESWISSDLKQHPALLLFFRGNWCPLCMAQIKEVALRYQQLETMGVKVFLISPQPESHTQSLAKKFQVNYQFMVDQNNQAAETLGIAAKQGTPKGMEVLGYDSDTVLPTAILTGSDGNIIFSDQTDNYRVRPEPDTFLRVFKDHGLTS